MQQQLLAKNVIVRQPIAWYSSQAQSDALPLTRASASVVCTTSDTNRNGGGQPTLHCLLPDNS